MCFILHETRIRLLEGLMVALEGRKMTNGWYCSQNGKLDLHLF